MKAIAALWRGAWGAGGARLDYRERLISAAGGFIGIVAVTAVSEHLLGAQGAAWIVASMGATAVLLFAVPHGQLSQPWPVIGGQFLSAAAGVTCAKLIGPSALAAAVALALAILIMHQLRCIHPPGGATALAAVLGGEQVRALGYDFLLTPVLVNVATLLLTAVAVNGFFTWRRYPLGLVNRATEAQARPSSLVDRADLDFALRQMNSYIDVTEDDLARILELAQFHARGREPTHGPLVAGGCYSNGHFGELWQVRKVLHVEQDPARPLHYRVVAGHGRGARGSCSREAFDQWARHRVVLRESSWRLRAEA